MKTAKIVYRVDLRDEKQKINNQATVKKEDHDLVLVEEDSNGNPIQFLTRYGVWRDLKGYQIEYHPKYYLSSLAPSTSGNTSLRFLKSNDLFRGVPKPTEDSISFNMREETYTLQGSIAKAFYQEARLTWLAARGRKFEDKVDYEIYNTTSGRRVNIGDSSYGLEVIDFTKKKHSFNVGDEWDGGLDGNGDLTKWIHAAMDVEVPLRYAWHGIMNAMGHHGSVSIPWIGEERDYKRDDTAPVPERDWKMWVQWRHNQWAEYIPGSPEKKPWMHFYNEKGEILQQPKYIRFPMATNVPVVANHIHKRNYQVVDSFEQLGGKKIPCMYPYYNEGLKYPKEERHHFIASLTGYEETYNKLIKALEERFTEFAVEPLQGAKPDDRMKPCCSVYVWQVDDETFLKKTNELIHLGLIWMTNIFHGESAASPWK